MRIIREFDPWKSSLCKCPPKYTFNPYTGCIFSCRYCYITSYIKDGFNPRKKNFDLYDLEKDLALLSKYGKPIALSLSTDAYQPLEAKFGLTRRILKILCKYEIPTLITTKSPLILRDIDILRNMNVAVSITITTLDRELAKKIEPYAPRPDARLKATSKLSDEGIPVTIRIDPIIPSITDDIGTIAIMIRKFREAGVKHIVASIYKAKPDNLQRILSEFPQFKETYRKIYRGGDRIGGYKYADKNYSFTILSQIREITRKNNLSFNTCRDGLDFLDTPGCFCDASHLLRLNIKS